MSGPNEGKDEPEFEADVVPWYCLGTGWLAHEVSREACILKAYRSVPRHWPVKVLGRPASAFVAQPTRAGSAHFGDTVNYPGEPPMWSPAG